MKKKFRANLLVLLLVVIAVCFALPAIPAAADAYDADDDLAAVIKSVPEPADAESMSFSSKSALLMDFTSGKILFEKNKDEKLPIASMTKIMTLLLTFESVDKGNIKLDDTITVSSNAAGMGGSQAFLDANASYKVSDLIKSCIVASANDSSVALAETINGSETAFVNAMNDKAAALGMTNTSFFNCTGLPAPNHYSTANDVALMTRALLSHKEYYTYSSIWMEDLVHPGGRVTGLTNTNKLTRFYNGCDGGKTGFTAEAKHCISATAKRGGLRLISVVIAAPDSKTRFAECSTLLNYGFGAYENKLILSKDKIAATIKVSKGKIELLKLSAADDFYVLTKKGGAKEESVLEYSLPEKVEAPVKAGDKIGTVRIIRGGELQGEYDIVAKEDIAVIGYFDILKKFINN